MMQKTFFNHTVKAILYALLLTTIAFSSFSCKDNEDKGSQTDNTASLGKGLYILCQGNIGHNNASIDFYNTDSSSLTRDIFTLKNSQGLGDVANDIIVFGDKIFITVEQSACVAVINANTAKLIKRIAIVDNHGKNRTPFSLAKDNKNLYVCCYDGHVLSINPSSLSIEKSVAVGRNPECICYANSSLYVSNSGGLEYQSGNYDTTISVLGTPTLNPITTISVGKNPGMIKQLNSSLIGVIVRGDYSNVKFLTISTLTNTIQNTFPIEMSTFDILGNKVLYINYDYTTGTKAIKLLDYTNTSITTENFVKDNSILNKITLPSNVCVSSATNKVYITDDMDYVSSGKVWVFDTQGNYLYNFTCSNIPWLVLER